MADKAFTRGDFGGLGSLVYICGDVFVSLFFKSVKMQYLYTTVKVYRERIKENIKAILIIYSNKQYLKLQPCMPFLMMGR